MRLAGLESRDGATVETVIRPTSAASSNNRVQIAPSNGYRHLTYQLEGANRISKLWLASTPARVCLSLSAAIHYLPHRLSPTSTFTTLQLSSALILHDNNV